MSRLRRDGEPARIVSILIAPPDSAPHRTLRRRKLCSIDPQCLQPTIQSFATLPILSSSSMISRHAAAAHPPALGTYPAAPLCRVVPRRSEPLRPLPFPMRRRDESVIRPWLVSGRQRMSTQMQVPGRSIVNPHPSGVQGFPKGPRGVQGWDEGMLVVCADSPLLEVWELGGG